MAITRKPRAGQPAIPTGDAFIKAIAPKLNAQRLAFVNKLKQNNKAIEAWLAESPERAGKLLKSPKASAASLLKSIGVALPKGVTVASSAAGLGLPGVQPERFDQELLLQVWNSTAGNSAATQQFAANPFAVIRSVARRQNFATSTADLVVAAFEKLLGRSEPSLQPLTGAPVAGVPGLPGQGVPFTISRGRKS